MDIKKRRYLDAKRQYEVEKWAQDIEKEESARLRRERDLADEKRRKELERQKEIDSKLDKRVADTLGNTEYRPTQFGGNDYAEYKKDEPLEEQRPIESVSKPTTADPEVPMYLKEPKEDSYLVSMLKANPTTLDWGKTSRADRGSTKEPITFDIYNPSNGERTTLDLRVTDTMLKGIEVANSVTDEALGGAQENISDAINNNSDPKHANFWGDLMTGVLDFISSPSGTPQMAQSGTYGPNLNTNADKKNWAKNAVGYGAIRKNEGEVAADANEINRYKEQIARGEDMERYANNIQQIIHFYDQIDKLKQQPATPQNAQLINDIENRISELQKETNSLKQRASDASTYYEDYNHSITSYGSSFGAPYREDKKGRSSIDAINNIVETSGYRGLSKEQKDAISEYTNNINTKVNDVRKKFDEARPDLLNRMADNIKELKSWMASNYNPDEEFTAIANSVTDFNFTDPKTYTHGMPGLIGSSMSFGGYQLASTALGLAATAAAIAGTGGTAGAAILGASSIGSTGLGIIGGHYENNTEGFDNYKQLFIDKLNKEGQYDLWQKEGRQALGKKNATDDEIMYAMAAGIYEPKEKIKDLATTSLYGLNNLYKNDMQAVVGSEIFEAGINFMAPMVKMARASEMVPKDATRFARMRRFITEHPNQAKLYERAARIKDGLLDSELGSAVAGSVSYPLGLLGRAAQAGVKSVVPKKMANYLQKAFSLSSNIIEKSPSIILGSKAVGKNLLDFSARVFGAGWSEAIEEGKQYLNGKKFVDGSYSGASDTFMDSIINDIAGGSRAAYSFIGDMFGATTDKELIANMKGGFLGGFGHTATIQALSAGYNTYQDLKVNDFVVNNVLAKKLADRTTIQNNSYLAQQTSPMQYEKVMNAFDAMEQIAQDAEEKNGGIEGLNFTADDIRNQKKAYQEVFNTANSKNVHDAARQLDIQPGTQKFGNFVGLYMWAKDIANQGVKNLRENENRANTIVNSLISGVDNDERSLTEILGNMSAGDLMALNEQLGIIDLNEESSITLGGNTYYNQNWGLAAVRNHLPAVASYIKEIASLDALFTLRDQLELLAEPTTADKRRLRSVNRQIKKLKQVSQFKAIKDAETADDFTLIPDQNLHDTLRDLYRESANYTTDIEEGAAMQYMLLGGKVAGIDFITSPELQEAYKNAQQDIKDRKASALSLIDRYVNSIKSDEELRQTIHDTFENTVHEEQAVEDIEMEDEKPVETPSKPSPEPEPTVNPEPEEEAAEEPENGSQEPSAEPAGIQPPNTPTTPTIPASEEPEPEENNGSETRQEKDEEDYDAVINQIESEYAPSTNTMFTSDDVNTDFGISKEDWAKVSEQVMQKIAHLMKRWQTFQEKWNGRPLGKQQWAGVNSWVIKFQKDFNQLREEALLDIAKEDEKLSRPETNTIDPTDDQIWESLHSEILFEQQIRTLFDQWVAELQMRWNHFIEARNDTNMRLYSEALANVYQLLNTVEDLGIQLDKGSLENYDRVKFDIDQFNAMYEENYGSQPEQVPPTVEVPSVRYEKPWAQYTTTHTHLESSRGYRVEDSVAVDDQSIRFSDVSANPDFIQNGIFWFTTRQTAGAPKIQLNVIYNGHQFTPIDIHTSDDTNGKGRAFYRNVINMLRNSNGRAVMPQKSAISRSNGIIDDSPVLQTLEQLGLFSENNMYSIEYSSSQDTFCIVQYQKDANGQDIPIAYIPGQEEGRSKHPVYEYSQMRPDSTKPADGGMVMMVHPPYPEIDKDQIVPINMHYSPLTDGDAQLIIDLLSGKYMRDNTDYGAHAMENQIFTEDGIGKGLTRMQVLRMLIRYKASGERYNPYQQTLRYVEYDREDQRYVILHGNFGEGVEIPNNGRFNILDENDQKILKEFLMAHHNKSFAYNEFLRCRVNRNNGDFNHPLHGLTEFKESVMGREIFKNGGQLRFGNSTIVFDEKDFGDASHPEGISGLAWAIRRGFVQSRFTGFSNTLLNFNEDIPLVYEDQEIPQQEVEQKKPETVADIIDDVIPDEDINESLEDMDLMTGEKSTEKFNIKKANEFLKKVLGEEISEEDISDKLAELARTNASVLGLCHYSGRLMFDPYAPQGTEYHEAFHKLVELILGDRTRKMLYKAYAKKMHIKYKNDDDLLSNKEIREGLAEEFRFYMEERPTLNLGSLRHPFKTLRQVSEIMGKIGDFRLYAFYVLARKGVIKRLFKADPQKVQRFLETHGAFMPFQIGGHEFKNILNRYQYRVLRNTLVYLVFRTNDISLLGDGIENFKISKQAILRDKNYQTLINSNAHGAAALQELVENIEYVEADIKNYIYNTFEISRNDDDEAENEQDIEGGEGAMEASFNQLKYSHESSQFSRAGAKVKFILARIPKKRFAYKNGKRVQKNILNDEGLVEYFDVKYVFNTLVNRCHDCRNAKELLNRLAKLGEDNAMFKYIHDEVISKLYDSAQKGDADAEAAFAQLLVVLHAAKGEYVIGKASRDADGTWNVTIQSTDSDYNAKEYKTVWSQLFANGSEYLEKTTNGYQMKFRKGTSRRYSPEVFHNIYNFFKGVKDAVFNGSTVIVNYVDEQGKVQRRELDVTKEDEFDYVKEEFCNTLQKLGIQFNKDELNYTLATEFGSSDYTALSRLFERTNQSNFTPFLDWINGCYNQVTKTLNITQNGTLNGKNIETAIGSFGFVGMLANAKYKYTHDHDQLSVLATKGNRYYVISENSLITDITDDINAFNSGDTKMMDELKSFSYNYVKRGSMAVGSLLMKQVEAGSKLGVVTVAGFRTDQKGDMGQDYAEISPAEDYITKCQILMQGGLIFPTMSDKKTWTYLTGINIPGLSFIPTINNLGNGLYDMSQDRNVLQQMLEYAECELQSIEECIKAVRGYTDAQGTKHPPMSESEKVMNYHKGEEYDGHTIIQGGRFGVLAGIYDEDGNFVSFNRIHEADSKGYVDEIKNWHTAQEYFFGVPDKEHPGMYFIKTKAGDKQWNSGRYLNEQELKEHQFRLLSRSLNKQVEREMDYAAQLGLIEKVNFDKNVPVILRYKNKLLDGNQIRTLMDQYSKISDAQQRESAAIAAYMTRISAASNISLQEVERIYAGHPAFFKWHYAANGELIDRSVDQHKRLGGLISTGQNNVLDIQGIPTKYVCAEVDNDMVGSNIQEELRQMMEDGELRSAYMRTVFEKKGVTLSNSNSEKAKTLAQEMEALSIDEIKQRLQDENPDIYEMLLKNATKKSNDFMSGIDVADGAAYVTDEMAEWLLRMVGSWDSKIERAFKILRGEEVDGKVYTTKDILTLQKAYQDVLTTVIGNQKYTAYGFRFANGVAAPYYDKMALFPMFKCLSTGATAKVFDKMKKEGVHMLMINSAVKVGSQGSKDMNMSNFREDNDPSNEANFNGDIANQDWKPSYEDSFTFNKYEQEFKYIRKQFNTDPNGKEEIKMGTQMTKVAMASIMPGRDYLIVESIDNDGNKVYKTASALEVRDDIMNCINKISDLGEKKVRERFIKEVAAKDADGNDIVQKEVDIEELSKFLKEELASRGASQEAIDAVSLTLDADGNKAMYIPPVAQNSLEWIQSIITSMINKSVIDINTPGAAFIQRSVWNMEGPTTVQKAEDLPGTIYEGRELQMINEEGTMDCVVSIDFYEDIIPEDVVRDSEGHVIYEMDDEGNFVYTTATDEAGNEIRKRVAKKQKKSFADARQWLIDNNIISGRKSNGQWSNATANFIGSRIPTQAQSSIHALRCVDVLPVVRDTIVLPKEFTKITGADFDIDKLFLSRFYFNNRGGKVSTQFKEGTHEYYANRLLSNYIALLKDTGSKEEENKNRTAHSNHASIDGDTKLLKDIIKDLEERKEKEPLDPYSPYSLWANAQTKTEFITGKFGIGPFALNNNSHILTMLYGVKFKQDGFLGMLGMNRLDLSQDRYGNSILSWLSGLINAHVDVAKDPYISRLNVNKYTYNLVNLLVRTGFGKDTFYFTIQPIMVEMAKAYNNAASQYGSESSRSKSRRQKEAVEEVIFNFVKRNFKLPSDVTTLKQANKVLDGYFNKVKGIDIYTAQQILLSKDNDILHQISKNAIPMDGKAKMYNIAGVMMSAYEIQYLVYRTKLEFEPYENQLSNLVRFSKIDTKKQGKNITEQMAYDQGVKDLFEPFDGNYGLFEDLSDYYKNSYIYQKTKNALDLFKDIMGSFTIESTPQFQIQVNKILREIGNENGSADMRKAVSRQIMNYIRAGFFNKWAEDMGIDIKGLVSGENTISDRLEDIRIKIMTDPEYADMKASDGSIKNYLLAALVQGFQYKENNQINQLNAGTRPATHNTAKFVKTLNFMDADHVNDDDMAEAWDELLNDPTHPELQSFARDLVMYAYITSGGNSGNNLFKFIPNSWKLNSYEDNDTSHSYAQYMQDQLYMYQTSREELPIDVNEIILNNWFDDKFIPTVKSDGFHGYYTGRYYYQGNQKPEVVVPIMLIKDHADPSMQDDDKYIKVFRNSTDPHTPRRYTIYKAVSYTTDGKLIYVMVDPKGNKFPRDVIYEMRRSDNPVQESVAIAAFSRNFTETVKVISEAMGSTGKDLSQIFADFISKLRDNGDVGTAIAMLDLATKDTTLKDLLKSAAMLDEAEDNNGSEQKVFYSTEYYTRDKVEKDSQSLYIFTDNTDRDSGSGIIDDNSWYSQRYGIGHHYPTMTQAVIRGLDNARPISTQRWYHSGAKGETGRWTDDAFDEFKSTIDAEIEDIKEAWRSGKYKKVVFPTGIDGFFGSKISNITQQRTPKIHAYLTQALVNLESYINGTLADSKQEAEQSGAKTYKPVTSFDLQTAELYSGAADGSDKEWGSVARSLGIKVKDYTGDDYRALSEQWRSIIEEEYKNARAFLGKPVIPIKDINNNNDPGVLTRRDMMQADKADTILAIVERIVKPGDTEKYSGKEYPNNTGHDNVQGGTANAVARGIIRGIPVYVFDQSDNQWKIWDNNTKSFIIASEQPKLTQHAAVIGTRQINEAGKKAIKSIFEQNGVVVSGKNVKYNTIDDTNISILDQLGKDLRENQCK